MLERELELLSGWVREAGRMVMEVYATDVAVDYKTPADPVTEADRRVNAFLVETLRQHFPDDGIVAEESAHEADGQALKARCWYVDPLDGTKEFIAKNGEFSVMVGLAVAQRATLGMVYKPVGDVLYAGVVEQGAWVEEKGQRKTLKVSDASNPQDLRLVVSRSHRAQAIDRLVQQLGIKHETCSGSVGLKVGLIAESKADLYVHFSEHASVWDACGPEAILRAAGGAFTDLEGKALVYRGEHLKMTRGLFASNGVCHAQVGEVVLPLARSIDLAGN